ncbi:MarR family winged helix-turn-helix transcriptional regulator [Sphingomonas sp. Xoc002]|uniref:MarR family winged helix-turn-helix transcriptional regulator n=1 Tax=Sphingomonas sp. Xoc002 TaxID=2837624 RepID=UPI003D177374
MDRNDTPAGAGPGTAAPFTYRSWPFYWLARASGRYREGMETKLRASGIDMPRWRVLMTLHQDKVASVSEIAKHAGEKLPTMTRIIQRMEQDDLVRRQPRPDKPWVSDVALTTKGEVAGTEAWEHARALYAEAFAGMSGEEIAHLNALLERVSSNLAQFAEAK